MPGPEAKIQKKVVNYAKQHGAVAIKLSTLGRYGTSGWPDYLFVFKGRFLFMEFKAPGERPTPLQAERISQLRAAGALVDVVDNEGRGKSSLNIAFVWGDSR